MSSSAEKGVSLERAVSAIETVILKSSPALRENTFKIESRKVVIGDGVRHEIDIYVEVDMGQGYKAIFIFECKNWEASVGKNDIIIFSEKVAVVKAQKGFFVAKSFSKDADAQAKKDARLELLIATEHDAVTTPVPFDFHTIVANVEMLARPGSRSGPNASIQIPKAHAVLDGSELNLQKYIIEWVDVISEENLAHFPSGDLPEGRYDRVCKSERTFAKDQLMVDGIDIASVRLDITFPVLVLRPPIVSHFEVEKRGRSISFAPVTVGRGTFQMGMVFRGRD